MILNKQEILNYLKEIKPELEAEGIIEIGLFGSYSRDKATEKSDIDICFKVTKKLKEKYPHLEYILYLANLKKRISSNLFNKEIHFTDTMFMTEQELKSIHRSVIYV